MRVNLKVPFAEKDAAKAAGARWDQALRVWYGVNVPDLTRFSRWIPEVAAFQATQKAPIRLPKTAAPKAAPTRQKAAVPQVSLALVDCGCDVPPWEECEHTAGR